MEDSGTLVNTDKSNVYFFNINCASHIILARMQVFNIGTFPMKYFSVPLNTPSLKIADWKDLLTHLQKRLQNWAFRALNALGSLIFLKSILQ